MPKKKETQVNEAEPVAVGSNKLDSAMAEIEKIFGKGSIMKLGDDYKADVEVVSTGSISLDWALGVGGLPKGRVIEIYGPESSGKTTLALSVIKQIQLQGGTAAFIDAEHAFDVNYAKVIGVNVEELLMSQPDTGEQALEIAEKLTSTGEVAVIVIDSVAALTPRAEMGDSHMGLQARLMSQALRKLTAIVSKTNTIIIFINQIRMKIGVLYGSPETTTGGNALKFYASVRIDLRRIASLKKGEDFIGNKIKATVKKNKVAAPFKQAELEIYFDEGISEIADVVNLAIKHGVIAKSGSWLAFEGEKVGQGVDNARKFLKENPKILKAIDKQICNLLGMKR
jgi:recombination protein RecA